VSNTSRGGNWYDDIPNEYQDGSIDNEDAMAHAFSLDHMHAHDEYMNDEEEYFDMPATLDPLDELIAQEEYEAWTLDNDS